MTTLTPVHPFEVSGLGTAPFDLIGFEAIPFKPGTNPMTCDHCGAAIVNVFRIQSSDGKVSKVGCDCVLKLGRDDNHLMFEVERAAKQLKKAATKARSDAKRVKESARIEAAFARLDADPSVRDRLAAQSHPKFSGSTLLAYVKWMRANAGHSGRLAIANVIESV